jgi:PHD/YefM family antitoxin component YafN of YafNO toxin-antitoxin module
LQTVHSAALEGIVLKTISTSDLRAQLNRVLNEVGYGRAQYVVERFGQPTIAISDLEDFGLLQAAKKRQATSSLRATLADIRGRKSQLDAGELDALIEEARAEFYGQRSRPSATF